MEMEKRENGNGLEKACMKNLQHVLCNYLTILVVEGRHFEGRLYLGTLNVQPLLGLGYIQGRTAIVVPACMRRNIIKMNHLVTVRNLETIKALTTTP